MTKVPHRTSPLRACVVAGVVAGTLVISIDTPAAHAAEIDCGSFPLQLLINSAAPGEVLEIKGTCRGTFSINKPLGLRSLSGVVLDAQRTGTVLTINPGAGQHVSLEGVTVRRGNGARGEDGNEFNIFEAQNGGPGGTGGIQISSGDVTLNGVTVEDNWGGGGGDATSSSAFLGEAGFVEIDGGRGGSGATGGINVDAGNVTGSALLIRNNSGGMGGTTRQAGNPGDAGDCGAGGLSVKGGTFKMRYLVVTGNSGCAIGADGGEAAGALSVGENGGRGSRGGPGGIWVQNAALDLYDSSIYSNHGGRGGQGGPGGSGGSFGGAGQGGPGALLVSHFGVVKLVNTTIANNNGGLPGGSFELFYDGGPLGQAGPGAIQTAEGSPIVDLIYTTVARNQAGSTSTGNGQGYPVTGGIRNDAGVVRLTSSLLALNAGSHPYQNSWDPGQDCSGSIGNLGSNLVGSDDRLKAAAANPYYDVAGCVISPPTDVVYATALLGNLTSITADSSLKVLPASDATSPHIGAVEAATCAAGVPGPIGSGTTVPGAPHDLVFHDARGQLRSPDCDIGAFQTATRPSEFGLSTVAGNDTGSSATDRITNNNRPTVVGRVNGADLPVTVRVDGVVAATVTSNAFGVFSFRPTAGSPLSDGYHLLSATTGDTIGGVTSAATNVSVFVDTQAPQVAFLPDLTVTPAGFHAIPAGSTLDIVTSFFDPPSAHAPFTVGLVAEACDLNGVAHFSVTGPPVSTFERTIGLGVGVHTISCTASDVAGNSGPASAAFDVRAGASSALVLTQSSATSRPGETVTFTATVSVDPAASGPPTGTLTIDILNNGTNAPCGTLDAAGVATCSLTVSNGLSPSNHLITMRYAGGPGISGSSGSVHHSVVPWTTSTVASSSLPDGSAFGQSVTFTATTLAEPAHPGDRRAPGSVAFMEGATVLCSATSILGTASCSTSALSAGAHTISAQYGCCTLYLPSSATFVQTVAPAASQTALTSAPAGATTLGDNVALTASVTAGTNPAGSVAFLDGVVPIPGCEAVPLDADDVVTCDTTALGAGDHSIVAVYGGSGNLNGSTSAPIVRTVTKGESTTDTRRVGAVSVTDPGEPVTFRVEVIGGRESSPRPTGTVTVRAGGVAIAGCVDLPVNGDVAVCTTPALPVGFHTVDAHYDGDANFEPSSVEGTVFHGVTIAPTTTALSSSHPVIAPVGFPITLTATVSVTAAALAITGPPTGVVTFFRSTSALPGCVDRPVPASGILTCTAAMPFAGSHTITARFDPSGDFNSSFVQRTQDAGNQQPIIVTKAGQGSGTVESAPGGIDCGVTCTAFFEEGAPVTLTATPTDANSVFAGWSSDCSGTGICALTADATHNVNATFAAKTSTSLSSSPTSTVSGQVVTFSATIVPLASGAGTPTGSVVFTIDGAGATTVPLSGNTAHVNVALGAVGSPHAISAVYTPDSTDFVASQGSTSHTVVRAATATAVAANPSSIVSGQSTLVTATITTSAPGAGTPTGTVQFKNGATNLGAPVTLVGGQAQHTLTGATATLTVTAVYSGSPTHAGSEGSAVVTVTAPPTRVVSGRVNGNLSMNGGTWIVIGADIRGNVSIGPGTNVTILSSLVRGEIVQNRSSTDHGGSFRLCGTTVVGRLTVSRVTGDIHIGTGLLCGSNAILSSLVLTQNTGAVVLVNNRVLGSVTVTANVRSGGPGLGGPRIVANLIIGALACSGNVAVASNNGRPNVVVGTRSGECRAGTF